MVYIELLFCNLLYNIKLCLLQSIHICVGLITLSIIYLHIIPFSTDTSIAPCNFWQADNFSSKYSIFHIIKSNSFLSYLMVRFLLPCLNLCYHFIHQIILNLVMNITPPFSFHKYTLPRCLCSPIFRTFLY